ncbi:MAG TPA: hypothetical protein VFE58_08560 [Tepidisphaeraceae bacterium]|jgi:hypothetical protein|nr:hypothetical protein [Tepidisphaeraceae bacterium]
MTPEDWLKSLGHPAVNLERIDVVHSVLADIRRPSAPEIIRPLQILTSLSALAGVATTSFAAFQLVSALSNPLSGLACLFTVVVQ